MKVKSGKTGNMVKSTHVQVYTKSDGTKVPTHYRSTANKCSDKKK